MTDMIEKVAKAIFEDTFKNVKWEDTDDVERRESMSNARAAIEALRVPSDEMKLRGNEARRKAYEFHRPTSESVLNEITYQAMISAALGEQEK